MFLTVILTLCQSYSESVLHFALTNKPDMSRTIMAPPLESGPRYRTRPTNPDELGDFIDHVSETLEK